ncbi:hypothetical protein JK358_19030 [Nocardia sp. 2]|uniref:PE-PGRS family protein n=1 Tax=Nocardia acididurans TaxID=2802282 RepID=A0ABS1M779_9NOCA|nr:hypothetical protein [Nocardia acididurans]MBL1076497.1 hypothetical protein [Nocardia acididurans]
MAGPLREAEGVRQGGDDGHGGEDGPAQALPGWANAIEGQGDCGEDKGCGEVGEGGRGEAGPIGGVAGGGGRARAECEAAEEGHHDRAEDDCRELGGQPAGAAPGSGQQGFEAVAGFFFGRAADGLYRVARDYQGQEHYHEGQVGVGLATAAECGSHGLVVGDGLVYGIGEGAEGEGDEHADHAPGRDGSALFAQSESEGLQEDRGRGQGSAPGGEDACAEVAVSGQQGGERGHGDGEGQEQGERPPARIAESLCLLGPSDR